MKTEIKNRTGNEGGFFSWRVLLRVFLCASACAITTGTLLAFFRPETPAKLSHRTLTFTERVAYQRAIEDVYWRHRIWPKGRPDPKPSLDSVISQAQLEKKVADYLRSSQALENYWQQPITAAQLQTEMERMARDTKQPQMLRELFKALGNDPFVVAECLARPMLSERLVTNFHTHDERSHGEVELRSTSWRARADYQTLSGMRASGASYTLPSISDDATCSDDTWIATTTTNAPAGRAGHTAVWTGSEMIVWGGAVDNTTGGRYDPSTDSWIATSTTNAPAGRYWHTAVWTGSQMIVWGGYDGNDLNTGGRYCAQPSAPIVQNAASRKTHGGAGSFDVSLPLSGTPGIECRSGGATNDYMMVVTFLANVSVNGSPQAAVTLGSGIIGSGGVSNGGIVTISGNVVTIPLTNVSNAQTINVTLNGVNGSTNVVIPMSILIGDTNANGTVNAADVAQTKGRLGQSVDATNFRSDVNANGTINAGDVSIVKANLGTGLP